MDSAQKILDRFIFLNEMPVEKNYGTIESGDNPYKTGNRS